MLSPVEKPVENVENLCLPGDKIRGYLTNYVNLCSRQTRNYKAGNRMERGGAWLVAILYVIWLGLTALVAMGLGRLKRWLLKKAKKKPTYDP